MNPAFWTMWGRSAWFVPRWCADGGRQRRPAEGAAAHRACSGCLLQSLQIRWLLLGPLADPDEAPGPLQQPAGTDRAIEARMADLAEAFGQNMLDQAVKEFDWMDRDGPALLGGERDPVLGGLLDPGVGDADPVGVAGQATTWLEWRNDFFA